MFENRHGIVKQTRVNVVTILLLATYEFPDSKSNREAEMLIGRMIKRAGSKIFDLSGESLAID